MRHWGRADGALRLDGVRAGIGAGNGGLVGALPTEIEVVAIGRPELGQSAWVAVDTWE